MRRLVLCLSLVSCALAAGTTNTPTQDQLVMQLMQKMQQEITKLQKSVNGLARQTMLQQLFVEERIRSDGGTGVKQIRNTRSGTRPWHNAIAGPNAIGIHEHSNYDRTVGLGELNVVMNGVDFRTRHNDYKLKMPSTTSHEYDKVEDIPFPDVPPSVTAKHNITEQIAELQEYFKAFHNQDPRHRDYEPYFKPVMCYMEGAWTTDTQNLQEPFESDRHHIDATSWFDLQEKVRFTSASGGKSNLENYSYLPTTIVNVTEDGDIEYAQWNYRILCHPIRSDLKLSDFEPVDDLAVRLIKNTNMTQYAKNKAARFSIAPDYSHRYHAESQSGEFNDKGYLYGRLDKIMMEIPGKDNYNSFIQDDAFELTKVRVDTKNTTTLNAARYHRRYKTLQKGAMGLTLRNRGFSDPMLYVAETKSPRVAKMAVKDCHEKNTCKYYESRHSYAMPLEIIWLTPLNAWNPYNLTFHNNNHIPSAHGRNGGTSADKAYNGTSHNAYYLTPTEFFHGGETQKDPADTAKNSVGVLDPSGHVSKMP